jgi:hypothetical protein
MVISRKSLLTDKVHEMDLPITQHQLDEYLAPGGPLLQDAFPGLTADQREFIKTGITKEEWNVAFPEEE